MANDIILNLIDDCIREAEKRLSWSETSTETRQALADLEYLRIEQERLVWASLFEEKPEEEEEEEEEDFSSFFG